MKLDNEIKALKWSLQESKEKDTIIEKLEAINTIVSFFDKNYGRAFFHIEKICNIPWLFFGNEKLILLTDKQANDINKIYEGE